MRLYSVVIQVLIRLITLSIQFAVRQCCSGLPPCETSETSNRFNRHLDVHAICPVFSQESTAARRITIGSNRQPEDSIPSRSGSLFCLYSKIRRRSRFTKSRCTKAPPIAEYRTASHINVPPSISLKVCLCTHSEYGPRTCVSSN